MAKVSPLLGMVNVCDLAAKNKATQKRYYSSSGELLLLGGQYSTSVAVHVDDDEREREHCFAIKGFYNTRAFCKACLLKVYALQT